MGDEGELQPGNFILEKRQETGQHLLIGIKILKSISRHLFVSHDNKGETPDGLFVGAKTRFFRKTEN